MGSKWFAFTDSYYDTASSNVILTDVRCVEFGEPALHSRRAFAFFLLYISCALFLSGRQSKSKQKVTLNSEPTTVNCFVSWYSVKGSRNDRVAVKA